MMVYTNGDLFESPAKVLVNTVNTHGVKGKGIALRFRQIYPEMFQRYREHCERGSLTIGKLHLYKTPHKWILNFPTKEHWQAPSRAEYIEAGLRKFRDSHAEIGVTSVAFPMLGCGNGGLDFEDQVEPLMERLLANLPLPTLIHADRSRIGTAGQLDQKRIEDWLRSEPAARPFDDVWRDIVILLRSRSEFMTGRSRFSVAAQDDPPMLHATSANRSFRITGDELAGSWQQLRDCGLAHRRIAPDARLHSFLVPVFGQLPYVRQIAVTESAVTAAGGLVQERSSYHLFASFPFPYLYPQGPCLPALFSGGTCARYAVTGWKPWTGIARQRGNSRLQGVSGTSAVP